MSKDWKTNRAEAAIKEGTDKIMKAAQALAKSGKETLFPEKLEEANQVLEEVGGLPQSFTVCLGVGMNQFFPEYITINLRDEKQ